MFSPPNPALADNASRWAVPCKTKKEKQTIPNRNQVTVQMWIGLDEK